MKIKQETNLNKNFLLLSLGLLSLVMFSSFVMGTVDMVTPTSFTNSSGSIVLNFTYTNGTDITNPTDANTTFYQNATGSFVAITTADTLVCNPASCSLTATASELTDGKGQTIYVIVGNDTDTVTSTTNSSNLILYSDTPTCSFSISNTETTYLDPVGITTTQSSTVDSLFTPTYSWILYDPSNNQQTTSSSSAPTFSESDFDETASTFTISLQVTDDVNNVATCSNQTVFVRNKDDNTGEVVTTTQIQQKTKQENNKNAMILVGILGFVIIFVLVAITVIIMIQTSKGRRRR